MVNITPAAAEVSTAQTADAYAAQAATRPLAGFGAGAFTREGASVGARVNGMTAALALPRIKPAFAASSTGHAQAGVAGTAHMTSFIGTAQFGTVQLGTAQVDHNNCIQTARLYPVIPGGVGPHPAREPVPV